jgi:hypothetical protein
MNEEQARRIACARAIRLAAPLGRGWARKNLSHLPADTLKQVWADKSNELVSVARHACLRGAGHAVAIMTAPLPPCAELVARGLSQGRSSSLALAVAGRGRPDPLPGGGGYRARVGIVWPVAVRAAIREMNSNHYCDQGRDGRTVAAGWHLSGTVDGHTYGAVHVLGGTVGKPAVTRRPAALAEIRAGLAAGLRDARAALAGARWRAMQAATPAERMAAGAALGSARNALKGARAAVANIRLALDGQPIPPAAVATWLAESGAMTSAGRMFAKRFRDRARTVDAPLPPMSPARQAAGADAFALALASCLG